MPTTLDSPADEIKRMCDRLHAFARASRREMSPGRMKGLEQVAEALAPIDSVYGRDTDDDEMARAWDALYELDETASALEKQAAKLVREADGRIPAEGLVDQVEVIVSAFGVLPAMVTREIVVEICGCGLNVVADFRLIGVSRKGVEWMVTYAVEVQP